MMRKKLLALLVFYLATVHTAENKFQFSAKKITSNVLAKMTYTWHPDSPIPIKDLRYILLNHHDFKGHTKQGELVVHKDIVDDIEYIFQKLFEVKFPIQSIKLVDEFDGSDTKSMQANNTSAFYARKVANTHRWSNHAFGCAIDINPLLNPYTSPKVTVEPPEAKRYLNRTLNLPGMITKTSYIYQLFKERGWQWGGECFYKRDKVIDYQHFQKIVTGLNKNTN